MLWVFQAGLLGLVISRPRFWRLIAMATYVLERSLYGAMAAVLIVPELATFFVFVGFALGLALVAGHSAWERFSAEDHAPPAAALIEP